MTLWKMLLSTFSSTASFAMEPLQKASRALDTAEQYFCHATEADNFNVRCFTGRRQSS
jgi:hypothetical protein